jgi:hypothetical protein
VKRPEDQETLESLGRKPDRKLLYESVSGEPDDSDAIRSRLSAGFVMFFCCCPPLDACLSQGGDDDVNLTQRLERSVTFLASPPGTVTANPADHSGQPQSR